MTKVMLVEDDDNLREIYGARLIAEGYEIISARDGEEALALAIKEKPDLLISDVMMPKISGFDMLDILRSSSETKNIRVIMMTALSQTEDKDRADKLGADRYLVKSQVTLEDVVKVTKEVLGETPSETPDTTPVAPLSGVDLSALTASTPAGNTPTDNTATPADPTPATAPEPTTAPADPTPAPQPEPVANPDPTPPAPAEPAPTEPAPVAETPPAPEPATPAASSTTTADDTPATGAPLNTNPDSFNISEDELQADPTPAPQPEPVANPDPTPPAPAEPAPTEPAPVAETPPAPATTDSSLAEAQKLIETAQSTDSELSSVQDQIQDFITNDDNDNPDPTPPAPAETTTANTTDTADSNPTETPNGTEAFSVPSPDDIATPPTTEPAPAEPTPDTPHTDTSHKDKKIIQPLNDIAHSGPDLNALLAQEEAKESGTVISPNIIQPS